MQKTKLAEPGFYWNAESMTGVKVTDPEKPAVILAMCPAGQTAVKASEIAEGYWQKLEVIEQAPATPPQVEKLQAVEPEPEEAPPDATTPPENQTD